MIRTIIVDDEILSRIGLQSFLEAILPRIREGSFSGCFIDPHFGQLYT